MRKFLILGASSEIALEYIKEESWEKDDILVLQYHKNNNSLLELRENQLCKIELMQCDFLSKADINQFCGALNEMEFVPAYILHTPAIPVVNRYFKEESWELVQKQMEVQCGSLFKILKCLLPKMAKTGNAKIVTVLSSCVIGVPPKYLTSYVIAKYALMGMVKSLANEYASKGIQINAVSPSMMPTKFCNGVNKHVVEQSAVQNPMKRNACVQDVVPVLKMLFDEKNEFVTGVNIPITGGEIY